MANIENYSDLKSKIEQFIGRRDQGTLEQIPFFINLAEKQIYRNLRIPAFETTAVYEVGPKGRIEVPQNLLDFKHVYTTSFETDGSEGARNLEVLSRVSLSALNRGTRGFARVGGYLWFTADIKEGFEILVTYYRDQAELFEDGDTNVMLAVAPDVLLFASLSLAARFNNDQDEEAKWEQLYQTRIAQVQYQSDNLEYSGGAMVIQKGEPNVC